MKKLYILLSTGVLSLIWCAAASATTYVNPNGKTTLNLSEKGNNRSGFYLTKVGNREFLGNIQITRSEGAVGSYYYNGTFKDSAIGPGKKLFVLEILPLSGVKLEEAANWAPKLLGR